VSAAASKRLAISLIAASVLFEAGHIVLGIVTGTIAEQGVLDVVLTVSAFVCVIVFAAAGYLIVVNQPRNTIGWLLIAIPMMASFAFFVGDYATFALVTRHGTVPLGRFAAWIDRWAIVPTLCMFIPLFLLFPDGRIPSRRWRPVLWIAIGAPALTTIAFALTPGRMTGAFAYLNSIDVTNPLGVSALAGPLHTVTILAGLVSVAAAFLTGASLVVRYRTRRGDERQQIKWLALVGVAFLVQLALAAVLGPILGDNGIGNLVGNLLFSSMFFTLAIGIPVACAVAILRYHLYDLDIVVRKTVVVGALALFVTAVYAIIVAGIGTAAGLRGSTQLSLVAAVAMAILFQPARDRARRFADRLVYGKRATPYEVLAGLSERMGDAFSTEDVLPHMARLLAEGTGATEAGIWLRLGTDLVPVASFPSPASRTLARVPARADADGPGVAGFPVVYQGTTLGEVTVRMAPADPLTPPKRELIRDFASQTGHVLRNVQLIEDLKASRARLVAAQDRERRALERNIHDGAQQQLVALAIRTKLASSLAGTAGAQRTAALLEDARARTQQALENLREVARGIYPPLLADKGLPAALEATARKSAVPVAVDADGVGRYAEEIEATLYFCALEALQNVAGHAGADRASVRLSAANGDLRFQVTDDGGGFDPETTGEGSGLQAMRDRLDALGGALEVVSAPGEGTTVTGHVPVRERQLA